MTESSEVKYPPASRIILKDLVGAKEYNGRVGIVQSKPNPETGRYQVVILPTPEERAKLQPPKMMAIQSKNMKWQPRPLESLNKVEMQRMLLFKKFQNKVNEATELKDMSDEGLRSMMNTVIDSEDDIPLLLAHTIASQSPPPNANAAARMRQQVQQMNPEALLQQAKMMKSTDPQTLRERVPHFRNLTDEQIKQAADQMEQMAKNPQQFQGMKNQFSKMSPQGMSRMAMGGNPGQMPSMQQGMQSLAQMSPAQLLAQAKRLKQMDVADLRRMNPAWARMTDEQIQQSLDQMELMAKQPQMMEQMKQQMNRLNPAELEKLRTMARSGQIPSGATPGLGGMGGSGAMPDMKTPPTMAKDQDDANEDEGETLTDEQIQMSMEMFDKMEEKQSGNGFGFFLFLMLLVGLLGGAGYWYFVKKEQMSSMGSMNASEEL